MGDPQSLLTASAALSAFHVPVVAVSPSFYSSLGGLPTHPNILTTAPELAGQARSLANIGSEVVLCSAPSVPQPVFIITEKAPTSTFSIVS